MNARGTLIVYSLVRLGIFAVVFAGVFLLLQRSLDSDLTAAVVSALVAALVSLCLSYIFLSKQRETLAAAIEERRRKMPAPPSDAEVEDEAVDRTAG